MKFKLAPAAIMAVGVLCFAAVAVAASAPKTSEWERTVTAAKGEGRVVIMGPAGADVRDAFTEGFQKKYPGIQADYNGMAGAQVAPKLLNELSAGVYRTDLIIAGTITAIESLIPANAIVPIQPYLAGPETQVSRHSDLASAPPSSVCEAGARKYSRSALACFIKSSAGSLKVRLCC